MPAYVFCFVYFSALYGYIWQRSILIYFSSIAMKAYGLYNFPSSLRLASLLSNVVIVTQYYAKGHTVKLCFVF